MWDRFPKLLMEYGLISFCQLQVVIALRLVPLIQIEEGSKYSEKHGMGEEKLEEVLPEDNVFYFLSQV